MVLAGAGAEGPEDVVTWIELIHSGDPRREVSKWKNGVTLKSGANVGYVHLNAITPNRYVRGFAFFPSFYTPNAEFTPLRREKKTC